MHDLLIYLVSMVIMVPITKRFGLGAIIGYLLAGALVGPQGLALLTGSQDYTSEIAEFGVVMMLLLIGLELNPRVLWKMRGPILGIGSLQVLSTTFVITLIVHLLNVSWVSSLAIGMILSVSSTAVVLQSLQELGYAKSTGGERAFAVLLFQDMAVIPMLALFPVLSEGVQHDGGFPFQKISLIIGAVALIVLSGRFLMRPLFKAMSQMKLRDTFTALALLIVAASAALMHWVGLSPALGAFLAGVALADSEYKHQIEADIEPFKGLLLGLFFITVGSNIHFSLIMAHPSMILGTVLGIVLVKAGLVYGVSRLFRMRPPEALLFAVSLAQGGEFAFVLIAQAGGLISAQAGEILTASVALTMALAPFLIKLTVTHGMSRIDCYKVDEAVRAPDTVDESEKDNPVMVIGIGRFGQTLIRFLRANGYPCTVLDIDSEQIEIMAKFGIKSYFGDGSNPDLLRAAGLDRAKVLVIAIDEPETTTKIIETIRPQYPNLPIFARAYDRLHAYKMLHLGVTDIAIETSGSALNLGTDVLEVLGMSPERALAKAELFMVNNRRSIMDLSKRFHVDDQETFIQASRQMAEQLEAMLKSDPDELLQGASSDWVPPSENKSPTAAKVLR